MADYVYRFNNATFGGIIDYTVPVIDMANYPITTEVVTKDAEDRTIDGELIYETMYSFNKYTLKFEDIGTTTEVKLERLVKDKRPLWWFPDWNNNPTVYKTVYPTDKLKITESITGFDITLTLEDVSVYGVTIVAFLE